MSEGPPQGVRTMSIVRWVIVAITALVAVGSILSYAGVHFGGAKSESSGQLYSCPMHPSVVQDHPGECQHDAGPEGGGERGASSRRR